MVIWKLFVRLKYIPHQIHFPTLVSGWITWADRGPERLAVDKIKIGSTKQNFKVEVLNLEQLVFKIQCSITKQKMRYVNQNSEKKLFTWIRIYISHLDNL